VSSGRDELSTWWPLTQCLVVGLDCSVSLSNKYKRDWSFTWEHDERLVHDMGTFMCGY
jgi:hypothetical protein